MRILLVNNFFYEVGGIERVFFAERELLQHHGHEVIDFSTQDVRNHPSSQQEFFVSSVDFQTRGNFFKKAMRFFYSREVDRALSKLIEATRPDVAHIHGTFDVLGPTVIRTLHRHGVRIIFTAHAYKLICPNWKLFAHGHVDEGCFDQPFHDAWNKSIQNSYIKSFGAAAAWWLHETVGTFAMIDRIISPSIFLIEKHVERGWLRSKFVHVPNPVDINKYLITRGEGAYILFVGRLVPEKGVDILIHAAVRFPEIPVKIIGDGPDAERLARIVHDRGISNVSFLGRRSSADVKEFMRGAFAVIIPSIWYENDSLSVLEAQAMGKVVIASYIGGIPEQIRHGDTGLLFEAGNPEALAEMVLHVAALSPEERHVIGVRARGFVDAIRNPEFYYEALMDTLGAV